MSSPRHGPCSCDIPERVARKDRAGEILPDLSGCLRKCAQNSGHYQIELFAFEKGKARGGAV